MLVHTIIQKVESIFLNSDSSISSSSVLCAICAGIKPTSRTTVESMSLSYFGNKLQSQKAELIRADNLESELENLSIN